MEQENNSSEHTRNLKKDLMEYVEKRIELFTLTLAEDLSSIIAHGFQRMAGLLLLSGAVLFAWLAFAFFLSELINSHSGGFALASLPLFVFAIIFIKRKSKSFTEKIQAELIGKMLIHFDKKTKEEQ